MATDPSDERLLKEIARRNWLILLILVVGSLFWRSGPLTAGVFFGGLIAIGFHFWRQRLLSRILGTEEPGGSRRYLFGFILRLGLLAVLLIVLLKTGVHPLGLIAGLSVVVLNILWATFKRAI